MNTIDFFKVIPITLFFRFECAGELYIIFDYFKIFKVTFHSEPSTERKLLIDN